ncbi:MAG: hypothetical protein P4L46_24160 [Fimbriimonas sp.]|nr:hypothetical protein [Fimbriimonas sp.]
MTVLVLNRRHQSTYLAMAEYWVYTPGDKLPDDDDVVTRMIRDNPYRRRGVSPIGTAEGLIFSDVRLHVALALRAKNPHIFRPDQFEDGIQPAAEIVEALKTAKALVKIRYVSDIPLKDKRHLQFLLHASDTIAELTQAQVIYDVKADRLFSRQELQAILRDNFDVTGSELQTSTIWKQGPVIGRAETRGLNKIGLQDLCTGDMDLDQRVLATHIVNEAIRTLWANTDVPESMDVQAFDDTFRLQFEKMKDKPTMVKILRVQEL